MEFDASWSLDSEEDSMAKMESGVNARAIDFAKLGRLMLHGGNWEGRQIVSKDWVALSSTIDPANRVQGVENVYYQYGWWINGPSDTRSFAVYGSGHLGQYLFIYPEENSIIVRFGKKTGRVDSWGEVFQEIIRAASGLQPGRFP
jgi:CubicO group peptidase (beta-lactamase class C family)